MSDPERDKMLREMAANRGCKLVKSRRRTPGTGDYGRYGLKDGKSDSEVFGFGAKGLTATPEQIEEFLRKGAAATWKSSLAASAKPAVRPKRSSAPAPPPPAPPPPAPPPAPPEAVPPPKAEPQLRIREADSVDSEAIASLLALIGDEPGTDEIAERLTRLSRAGEPPLIAKQGEDVVGCVAWQVGHLLHRASPVGRITLILVAPAARRGGVGRALIEAAQARLAARGCTRVEAPGGMKRSGADAFYRRLGFEKAGYRWALPPPARKKPPPATR